MNAKSCTIRCHKTLAGREVCQRDKRFRLEKNCQPFDRKYFDKTVYSSLLLDSGAFFVFEVNKINLSPIRFPEPFPEHAYRID